MKALIYFIYFIQLTEMRHDLKLINNIVSNMTHTSIFIHRQNLIISYHFSQIYVIISVNCYINYLILQDNSLKYLLDKIDI